MRITISLSAQKSNDDLAAQPCGANPAIRLRLQSWPLVAGRYIAVYFAFTGAWFVFWILISVVLGILLSDMSWLRAMQKGWPFISRVMDWETVKRVADED